MSQLLIPSELGAASLTRSRDEAFAVARARVLDPHAKSTQRAYRIAINRWTAHCDDRGMPWAPIDPVELVVYLEEMATTRAPNTVRLHLSALCELDSAARFTPTTPNPASLRAHPVIERWYESWSREHGTRPRKQAAAMNVSQLELLIRAAQERPKHAAACAHVLTYVRDRCLILFGVCGALRGNDLAQITVADIEPTERGLRVRVPRSKTDQSGVGQWVGIMPQGRTLLCPVDAWHRWRSLRGDTPGPVFVGTTRAGTLDFSAALSERSIARLVTRYAKRAGIELAISSHSLRTTFATLATQNGKRLERVMRHGRWLSAETALGYMRQAELFDDNPSGGLFD